MRPSPFLHIISALVLLACFLCGACSLNHSYLRTHLADQSEISGSYSVILYGAHYYNNIATVALLIPEGGQYTFEVYSPKYNYSTIKGLPADKAVRMAEKFVSWHPEFLRSQTSKIVDSSGNGIAYEIRPLYEQTSFGVEDVMNVDYFLEDNNKVVVHIHLVDKTERIFMGDDQGKVH